MFDGLQYCKYGCGRRIVWRRGDKLPREEYSDPDGKMIIHTYKRCADIQIAQGRKPYFFDKVKK